MAWGLSDADRERMRRAAERAERRMAKDRKWVHDRLDAEHHRVEVQQDVDADEQAHRQRFGPLTVTGPDGVPVHLVVRLRGVAKFGHMPPSRSGPLGLPPELAAVRGAAFGAAVWQAVTRSAFVLVLWAPGLQSKYRRIVMRDEVTAQRMFAQAVAVVRSGGLGALRRWVTVES